MPRINQLFAFIAEEGGPEDEGLAAFLSSMGWMPMVAADSARVDKMRAIARTVAKASGKKIRLVKFSLREELEVFLPEGSNEHGS